VTHRGPLQPLLFCDSVILEVRTCYCKQSAFSQCDGNSLQSRKSLGNEESVIPSQQAAPFADWKWIHKLPQWCKHLNLGD